MYTLLNAARCDVVRSKLTSDGVKEGLRLELVIVLLLVAMIFKEYHIIARERPSPTGMNHSPI